MTIDLADYEAGDHLVDSDDYADRLAKLQKRLSHIQTAHIIHKRRAIILFEGWDAAGKGGIIKRLSAEWDPRYFEVWPIAAPTAEELSHHFLWRFWRRLPAQHNIAIFDRSWYGRVLVERVEQLASKADWKRGYDEINAFEAQQIEDGATLIKVFVHVTQKTQDKRLRDRVEHPWKRWKIGSEDFRNRARRADYVEAMHDMFRETDTKHAPWTVIDGNHKKSARIAALEAIADQLEAHVPMDPPELDPELAKMAKKVLGD
ncbi:polyphosphate kinase 2 family protein [Sphingomonas sp. MMS12-HWE2-04]|uniref:polyphosphate kinase 2 family protein n=1 Tax=Sphingomonas sp. MMS12-HWE2-04 TaxID=3234199 RepID=UPI003850D73E